MEPVARCVADRPGFCFLLKFDFRELTSNWIVVAALQFRWPSVPVCLQVLFVATYWYCTIHCLLFGSLTYWLKGPKCVVLCIAFIYIVCVNTALLVSSELDGVWRDWGKSRIPSTMITGCQAWRLFPDRYTYTCAFRFRFSQRCNWGF
jgi:hypothetical protein